MEITNHENDNRRSGYDRRQFNYAIYLPERRSGKERRAAQLIIYDYHSVP